MDMTTTRVGNGLFFFSLFLLLGIMDMDITTARFVISFIVSCYWVLWI